jgi:hypothetical protein
MIPKLALTGLIALALCAPVQEAAAQDPVGGAIAGGVLGGGRGAAVGAIVGAGTGAAIAAQGEPRPGGYRYYQNGCYVQQPDGSWAGVSPRYCQTVQYAPPPQRYYDDTPRCMRSPTYDPRSGTFVGRDGYRYACP